MRNILENIKQIRKNKGYNQQFLASKLGISQAHYSAIEKGIGKLYFEILQEIAIIFEMDVCEIINFHSNSPPDNAQMLQERTAIYEKNNKKPLKYTVENQDNEIIIRVILEKD
jgi:transcriptional regulator with XRE-family HTH domain